MTRELPSPEQMAAVSKLFALLDPAGREQLLKGAARRLAAAGEVICREGEAGDEFFVIVSGRLEVQADDFGTARHIATLAKGAFCGEMAVLANQPRSATVVAREPTDLLVFTRPGVEEVLRTRPAIRQALGRVGVERTEQLMNKLSS